MSKLKREVEKAKRTLSSQFTTKLEIESFEGGNDFSSVLTRVKFEELCLDLFKQILDPVTKMLQDGKLNPQDINDVVLDYFGGLEPRMGINPDEAVAYGAAVQGSILARISPFDDTLLLIDVLQGESIAVKDNIVLGTFKLTGIPPAARGVPQIKVTFDVDVNRILMVIAFDKDSGNSESITLTSEKNQLARGDIDWMVSEAQRFTQEDRESQACSAALNKLQESTMAKRASLDASNPREENHLAQRLVEHYSNWAKLFGGAANLTELNRQITEDAAVPASTPSDPGAAVIPVRSPALPEKCTLASTPGGLIPPVEEL
ncbi:ATPase with role in protein import into the ER [Ceratobasidium sp. 394]|nr:ATPase with role in protein import into the ER [Ceratobasidium sp. 394]